MARTSRLGKLVTLVALQHVLKPFREKQLLCMARAILKRSKVLVMDEVRGLASVLARVTDIVVSGNCQVKLSFFNQDCD